jgi:bacterioferritin-associated ferredoxin
VWSRAHYWLGHRLHEVEEARLQGELVCECELVTRTMLEQAAANNPTVTLDDLRRDVRLGMGPCQGGFCTFRAAGILQELRMTSRHKRRRPTGDAPHRCLGRWPTCSRRATTYTPSQPLLLDGRKSPLDNPNLLLRDFLQERWRGVDAGALGPPAQAGAAGRIDLPQHHEHRPPAAQRFGGG